MVNIVVALFSFVTVINFQIGALHYICIRNSFLGNKQERDLSKLGTICNMYSYV